MHDAQPPPRVAEAAADAGTGTGLLQSVEHATDGALCGAEGKYSMGGEKAECMLAIMGVGGVVIAVADSVGDSVVDDDDDSRGASGAMVMLQVSGGVGMPLGSGMAGRCPSRRMPPVSIAVAAVLVGTTVVGTVVAADTGTDDVAGRSRSMLSTTCCSSDEMYARTLFPTTITRKDKQTKY